MLTDTAAVTSYFSKLGLEQEVANIYLALYAEGPQSISALARSSGVERTKIYRLIDRLLESNLVEIEPQAKRGIIKAAPIANLHILIAQKEQELKSLHNDLGLIEQLLARNSLSNPSYRTQLYQGVPGIKQLRWNQTRSKTEIVSILSKPIDERLGKAFFVKWVDAVKAAQVRIRLLVSSEVNASLDTWYPMAQPINQPTPSATIRQLPPIAVATAHNTVVWDTVTSFYEWKDGDAYGIEIYNESIAKAQRAYFETLWGTS